MSKDCLAWSVVSGTKCPEDCPLFDLDRNKDKKKIRNMRIAGQIFLQCVADRIPLSNQGPSNPDGTDEHGMGGWVDEYKR